MLFWLKVTFIFVCFTEGMISGLIPTWSDGCTTNSKILGIANSFAAGVFMAIAFIHVLPEEIEAWNEISGEGKVFPLPELLAFVGYTIILILDKVLFDTHALFHDIDEVHSPHGHACDPVEQKLE